MRKGDGGCQLFEVIKQVVMEATTKNILGHRWPSVKQKQGACRSQLRISGWQLQSFKQILSLSELIYTKLSN